MYTNLLIDGCTKQFGFILDTSCVDITSILWSILSLWIAANKMLLNVDMQVESNFSTRVNRSNIPVSVTGVENNIYLILSYPTKVIYLFFRAFHDVLPILNELNSKSFF